MAEPPKEETEEEKSWKTIFRYAMFVHAETGETIIEDKLVVVGNVMQEKDRIKQKVLSKKLNPNERQKIGSKKLGKWQSMTDDHHFIGIVCVKDDYPERLAYKMINEVVGKMVEAYGEDEYHQTAPSQIKAGISEDFAKLVKKYDNPASFDSLVSAQAKVNLAKDKMAANQQQAMANQQGLENLESKTGDLLAMAKDFHKDANSLESLMKHKNLMNKIYTFTAAIGGGGTIVLPIILCCAGCPALALG